MQDTELLAPNNVSGEIKAESRSINSRRTERKAKLPILFFGMICWRAKLARLGSTLSNAFGAPYSTYGLPLIYVRQAAQQTAHVILDSTHTPRIKQRQINSDTTCQCYSL